MACVRKRRGKWVVDWRDGAGTRRIRFFEHQERGRELPREGDPRIAAGGVPRRRPNVTWPPTRTLGTQLAAMARPERSSRARSRAYADQLRLHILPALGGARVRGLHRAQSAHLARGEARNRAGAALGGGIYGTLRAMLSAAVDDGVLVANPAARLGRTLRLAPHRRPPDGKKKSRRCSRTSDVLPPGRLDTRTEARAAVSPSRADGMADSAKRSGSNGKTWPLAAREATGSACRFGRWAARRHTEVGAWPYLDLSQQLVATLRRLHVWRRPRRCATAARCRRGCFRRHAALRSTRRTSATPSRACSRRPSCQCTSRRIASDTPSPRS